MLPVIEIRTVRAVGVGLAVAVLDDDGGAVAEVVPGDAAGELVAPVAPPAAEHAPRPISAMAQTTGLVTRLRTEDDCEFRDSGRTDPVYGGPV